MITRLKLYALIAAVFIAAVFGLRWKGGQDALEKERARRLEDYHDTRRRMDDANPDDLDADAARRWLLDRSKRDRDL
jgi:hypothetical protein